MNINKNYLLTAILFSTMRFLYAQNESQEAENQIKKSTEALTAKNFIEASKALQKAKDEVVKLLNNQLTASLPTKFENWTPVADSKEANSMPMPGMPMGMTGMSGSNEISVTKIYETAQKNEPKKEKATPPAIKKDSIPGMNQPTGFPPMPPGMNMGAMGMNSEKPQIIVIISSNTMLASQIASANSGSNNNPMMGGPMGSGEDTKALKIKNYRAMAKNNKMMKSCEVDVIVGAATVQIIGSNLENSDILQKFADQIDYQKIKAVLGE